MDAILNISKRSMMPEWHQLDLSSTRPQQQESTKKKTLKSSSRSFWFSTGLILSLFINDLPLFMNYCYSDFFADDASLHTRDNKRDKVEEKLQCDADNAKEWSRQNNRHMNHDKTNYMILDRTNKQRILRV